MSGAVEVYVINADGTGLSQVTHDNGEDVFPVWSPDGTRILFSTQYPAGNHDYTIWQPFNPDGTDRRVLTHNSFDDIFAEYTIDGKQIIFSSTRGNLISAIWQMNSDGSHNRRLTPTSLEAGAVDVSPDGQHMVFINQNSTELPSNLIVSNLDATHRRNITSRGQCIGNGRKVVFSGAVAAVSHSTSTSSIPTAPATNCFSNVRIAVGCLAGDRSGEPNCIYGKCKPCSAMHRG